MDQWVWVWLRTLKGVLAHCLPVQSELYIVNRAAWILGLLSAVSVTPSNILAALHSLSVLLCWKISSPQCVLLSGFLPFKWSWVPWTPYTQFLGPYIISSMPCEVRSLGNDVCFFFFPFFFPLAYLTASALYCGMWNLLLQPRVSPVETHGLSYSVVYGILVPQTGIEPAPLYCKAGSLPLNHQESPRKY